MVLMRVSDGVWDQREGGLWPETPGSEGGSGLGSWVCPEPVQETGRLPCSGRLRAGARLPPGDLPPGLRTEEETQASVDQGAWLGTEPEVLAKRISTQVLRGGQRDHGPGLVSHSMLAGGHCPPAPEAVVGA